MYQQSGFRNPQSSTLLKSTDTQRQQSPCFPIAVVAESSILYWFTWLVAESLLLNMLKSWLNPENQNPSSRSVLSRLRLNEPIARHLGQAQAILTQPGNVPMSLAELHRLSDDLCFYSGDRSHSFDWYAKRMAISSLYVASELFMSQDKSLGFKDTFEFVDRRLDELENTKYVVNSVTEWSSFFEIFRQCRSVLLV